MRSARRRGATRDGKNQKTPHSIESITAPSKLPHSRGSNTYRQLWRFRAIVEMRLKSIDLHGSHGSLTCEGCGASLSWNQVGILSLHGSAASCDRLGIRRWHHQCLTNLQAVAREGSQKLTIPSAQERRKSSVGL
eukprot:855836-Amphidinium_carterae.1